MMNEKRLNVDPQSCSIAEELCGLAEQVAESAEALASSAHKKLAPIMIGEYPQTANTEKKLREFPELFDFLRSKLDQIQNCIHSTIDAISRSAL